MAGSVVFLGGSGVISAACVARAQAVGWRVTVVNRGRTSARPAPAGVEQLTADITDRDGLARALAGRDFDVVCQFLAFTPNVVAADADLFAGRTGQYVFISSASAYQKPPQRLPITEDTPLENPFWQYSRDKIACEQLLWERQADGFPVTIVRPSHTYDDTKCPLTGGGANLRRLLHGAPVLIHDDGRSLWTLTHADDFATGFVGLLGRSVALGEAFHITSDEALSWNRIAELLAEAAGTAPRFVHVPAAAIATLDPEWGAGLLGDKSHSMVLDNTKVKRVVPEFVCTVPFAAGARRIIDWYRADPARVEVRPAQERLIAGLIERYETP